MHNVSFWKLNVCSGANSARDFCIVHYFYIEAFYYLDVYGVFIALRGVFVIAVC